jgi:hypothetical protein
LILTNRKSGYLHRNDTYSDRGWRKEAGYFHLFGSVILQHVDAALREEHGASFMHCFHQAFDHRPSRTLKDVDDFFSVGVRVRRPHRFALLHMDDAHGAVLRIGVFPGHDPLESASQKLDWKSQKSIQMPCTDCSLYLVIVHRQANCTI